MELELGLLKVFLVVLLFIGSCSPLEECEVKRQRRCRQNLVQELERHPKDSDDRYPTRQLEVHCRKLRENLNCLVLQVTRCPTPNRKGDLIERAWKYMEENCDTFGGWWNYECFHLEQVKKCEKIFALRDAAASHASCREYDRFRHCVSDVITKHCDVEDELSMGNYLLDSAGDMIWTCPHQSGPLKSPIVDEGFVGVVKKPSTLVKKVLPFDKFVDPLEPHVIPPLGVDLDPLVSSIAKKPAGVGASKIAVEESHLTGVYSSALTGNSPFVTGCNARATEEMRGCLDRHQYERDQALGAKDDEDRLRKECCATWHYRKCLQNAVRIHCYDTREVDIQSAVDVIPHDRGFLCRNHWIYSCSGAMSIVSSQQLLAACIIAIATMILQRTVSL